LDACNAGYQNPDGVWCRSFPAAAGQNLKPAASWPDLAGETKPRKAAETRTGAAFSGLIDASQTGPATP